MTTSRLNIMHRFLCNRLLLLLLCLILASGIQLEVTDGISSWSVWAHIVCGILFFACIVWHIFLHFRWQRWFVRFAKLKSLPTRILWWLAILTLISALAATMQWLLHAVHSSLGGVHGKIGFLMVALAIGHTIKRAKFYTLSSKDKGTRRT